MNLPQTFHSCNCGGGSASPSYGTPSVPNGANICNSAYYNLATNARLNLIGIAVGSNCQNRFIPSRGFVLDDGSGAGQFIGLPQVTLPPVNGGTVGAWNDAAQFPVLVGGIGADPHSWRFIYAPTTGSYRLETQSGMFKFVPASSIPGVDGVCEQETTVGMIRPFGCYVPDATVPSPDWQLRRLGLYPNSLLTTVADGGGNLFVKCLNPESETFYFAGTIRARKLQYTTIESLDEDGDPVSGGFAVLNRATTADAVLCYFSPGEGLFYRSPAHVRETVTSSSTVTQTLTGTYAIFSGHLTFPSKTFNHPNVEINWSAKFDDQEQVHFALFRDNSQVTEWLYGGVTTNPNSQFSGSWIDKNVPAGDHVYDIRMKASGGSASADLEFSSATMKTLTD